MLVLGLLLLLHHVWSLLVSQNQAKELIQDTNYVVKAIDSCPRVGYFFRHDFSVYGPGLCRLCFCKDNGTAVCWNRDINKCDNKHYNHRSLEKRDRVRRSPGFTDIFFRDAARDFFSRQTPEQCKPHESSFSEDCPPADWCTGCTVCDCDANGRWDCHLLSFCPEKDKNKNRVKKGHIKRMGNKRRTTRPRVSVPTRTKKTVVGRKSAKKLAEKRLVRPKKNNKNLNKKAASKAKAIKFLKNTPQSTASRKHHHEQHRLYKKSQSRKATTRKPKVVKRANTANTQKKPIIVKRLVTTKKPRVVKVTVPGNNKNPGNNSLLIARRAAVKSYMKNLKKALAEQLRNLPLAIEIRKKRSVEGNNKNIIQQRTNIDFDSNDISADTDYKRRQRDLLVFNNHTKTDRLKRHEPHINQIAVKTNNGTVYIAQKVVKKVMTAVRKILNKSLVKQKRSTLINNKNTKSEQTIDTKSSNSKSRSASMKKTINKKQMSKDKLRRKRNLEDITHLAVINTNYTNPSEPTEETKVAGKVEINLNNNVSNYFKYSVANTNVTYLNTTTDPIKNYYTYSLDDITYENKIKYNYTTATIFTEKESVLDIFHKSKLNVTAATTTNAPEILTKSHKSKIIPVQEESFMNINDLKFKNWHQEKSMNDINGNSKSSLIFELYKNLLNNRTNEYTNKLRALKYTKKDIKRKISKKSTLKKLVKTRSNKNISKIDDKNNFSNPNITLAKNINTNISNLQQFFRNMILNFTKPNATTLRSQSKKYNVIKYMKNLFKKIRFGKTNKRKLKKNRLNKYSVFKTLCETFGPCKVPLKKWKQLEIKIDKLTNETHTIFHSIKIIKGLLQLMDPFPPKTSSKDIQRINYTKTETNIFRKFKNDIKKYSSILRGTYIDEIKSENLTESQITQINYIKDNMHTFIRAIGKFSGSLNDVIETISSKNNNIFKSNQLRRRSRYALQNYEHRQQSETLNMIKKLLLKYNLFHSNFVIKINKVLMEFENKLSKHVTISSNINEKNMIRNDHITNNTIAIDIYTSNIISNLKKLRTLADNVNAHNIRTKRQISQDDDAIEYLLMLMEYLLKQNYPLDVAPVNDGIDLLIDAIRSAPDIKPIKKKVLQYTSTIKQLTTVVHSTPTTTTSTTTTTEPMKHYKLPENLSVSEHTSNEVIAVEKAENKEQSLLNQFENTEVGDDDDQSDNKATKSSTDIYLQDVTEDTTEPIYYNQEYNETAANNESILDKTTETLIRKSNNKPLHIEDKVDDFIDNIYVKKEEKQTETRQAANIAGNDNNDSKYEFNNDINEDEVNSSTAKYNTETETDLDTTSLAPINNKSQEISEFMKNVKMKSYSTNSDISTTIDKKIDWIDIAYDDEIREASKMKFRDLKKRTTEASPILTKTTSQKRVISGDNISSITKETMDERTKKKTKFEDILQKKQMDLLNSLDYGSKSAVEDVEVKDVTQVDSEDAFPMYFV